MVYSPAWPCGTTADSAPNFSEREMFRGGTDIEEAAPESFEREGTLHSEQKCHLCSDKEGGGRGIGDDGPRQRHGRNLPIGQLVSP